MMRYRFGTSTTLASRDERQSRPIDFGTEGGVFPAVVTIERSAAALSEVEGLLHAIEEIRALRENWDGHGAVRVGQRAVDNTASFVNSAFGFLGRGLRAPSISPNPNGTISMEWESPDGEAYAEFGNERAIAIIKHLSHPTHYMHGMANEIREALPVFLSTLYMRPTESLAPTVTSLQYSRNDDEPHPGAG